MISRRRFLQGIGAGAAAALLPGCSSRPGLAGSRPNILFLTGDDLGGDTPGCFGGLAHGITPRIDALAATGMRFPRAHVNIAVCQPSRAVLLTGRYPHRNGLTGFLMGVDAGVPTLSELLSGAGYRTALLGKEYHYEPRAKFRWDTIVTSRRLGNGRDPAAYAAAVRKVIRGAADTRRPYFIHANSHDPHRPFHGSDEARAASRRGVYPDPSRVYAPNAVTVPGFLPDLPDVRTEIAQYCSSVRRLDDWVGAVLDAVSAEGAQHDTLVVFLSDNGMSFPFAKASCYLASIRTPLIVSWPGRIAAAADPGHFVSAVDLMPTLLEIAAPDAFSQQSTGLDGRSFVPLLEGREQDGRDQVAAVFHSTRAGDQYEMRAVHRERFGYIWNPWADGKRVFHSESQHGLSMRAMREAARTDANIAQRVKLFRYRVPEELYDYETDPHALANLAIDPAHAGELAAMRERLASWMRRYGDPLADAFGAIAVRR